MIRAGVDLHHPMKEVGVKSTSYIGTTGCRFATSVVERRACTVQSPP
ncbi:uncharacterized protein G2W53_003299 [Senna tora]|uniref:Uncharacterized protein n=1 Tax=Senna tora TaxID=362788 RepID=A0A835CFM3_9FABA|nr:uncharacterized protein G2W53_003299 [Senna tora]